MQTTQVRSSEQLVLPHSIEAEKGLLGSIFQSAGKAIPECVEKIRPEFFYVPAHRTIYNELLELWESRQAIDLIDFTQRVRDKKTLESVGGAGELTCLATNFVPTAANIAYYIDIVREKYVRREAITAFAEAEMRLYHEQDDELSSLNEIESKLALLLSIERRNGSELSLRSPTDILAIPRDEYVCILGDRLLAKGQSLVIAGVGGIGKTRLLLQLLVAFIIGRPWCGIETHAKALRCLLIQTENGTDRLQRDLEALKKWAGEDWKLVEENLLIHTLETEDDLLLHLSEPENARRLEVTLRKVNAGIVAFDPLRDFGIGDLNSDADMSATLRELGRIARVGNPNRALILLHHAITGRSGAAKAFGLERTGFGRGSKVLHTYARGFVNVVPGAENDNQTLILTCGKNSNGKEFPPVAVRLNAETMIYEVDSDFDIENYKQKLVSGRNKAGVKPEVLREILDRGREYDKKQLATLTMEETGIHKSRAYEIVDEAKRRGVLCYNNVTKTYVLV